MNPQIVEYIAQHRGLYTREAIDRTLRENGYAEAQIQEAWAAVQSGSGSDAPAQRRTGWGGNSREREPLSPGREMRTPRFWITFIGYLVGLWGLSALLFALNQPEIGIAFHLLALIGAFIASLLLLRRDPAVATALAAALLLVVVLPFIVLVIVAGICIAVLAGMSAQG